MVGAVSLYTLFSSKVFNESSFGIWDGWIGMGVKMHYFSPKKSLYIIEKFVHVM